MMLKQRSSFSCPILICDHCFIMFRPHGWCPHGIIGGVCAPFYPMVGVCAPPYPMVGVCAPPHPMVVVGVCAPHQPPMVVCWCVYVCMKRKIYLNLTVKAFKQGLAKRVNSRCFFCLRLHQLAPHSTTGVSVLTMYSHFLVFSTLWLGYLAGLTHFRRLVFSFVFTTTESLGILVGISVW